MSMSKGGLRYARASPVAEQLTDPVITTSAARCMHTAVWQPLTDDVPLHGNWMCCLWWGDRAVGGSLCGHSAMEFYLFLLGVGLRHQTIARR